MRPNPSSTRPPRFLAAPANRSSFIDMKFLLVRDLIVEQPSDDLIRCTVQVCREECEVWIRACFREAAYNYPGDMEVLWERTGAHTARTPGGSSRDDPRGDGGAPGDARGATEFRCSEPMPVDQGSFRQSPLPLPPHCRKPFSLKSSVIDSPCGDIWFGVAASGYGFINSVPHHRRRVHE